MQLSTTLIATIIIAAAVSSATPTFPVYKRAGLPSFFTVDTFGVDDAIYPHLYYANSSLFLGNIRYETYSEPFLAYGNGANINFLSIHSAAEDEQSLYVQTNSSSPVAFTEPGSLGSPNGSGFAVNGTGGALTWNGAMKWKACAAESQWGHTYQVYWDGQGSLESCADVVLVVQEEKGDTRELR